MPTTVETPAAPAWITVADLLRQLGDLPAHRVRLKPTPGTATEQDLLGIHDREGRLCELVDGVLVEKPMGYHESRAAAWLIHFITNYLVRHDVGEITGPDATIGLLPGLVRMPDVAFVTWARHPSTKSPIPRLVPDLTVEILRAFEQNENQRPWPGEEGVGEIAPSRRCSHGQATGLR
jgi:Uma2 family endonuclease